MANSYFVAPGKAVSDNRRGGVSKVVYEGQEFPCDNLSADRLADMVNTGYLIRKDQTEIPQVKSTAKLPALNTEGNFDRVIKWDANPQSLSDQPLTNLNNMVKAKDTKAPKFEDKNEAIIFLSQDFKRASD
jgi:hypothetical protein